ncbi:hypothetical protein B0H12DRAFT_1233241 [Mycena haematopus]|nr:hypothetical protein B0H12DRAFT_1233241 [Mycena haematopus]
MEIEFLIIDQFEGDTVQLRDFCLVSRAWASYSQSLLFRNVYVRSRNFMRFLAVLETTNDLGRHIVTLNVTDGTRWAQSEDRSSVLDAIRPILANKLCNLQTLDLSYKYFHRESVQPTAGWASISRLQVRFCRFATANNMFAFFAAFPRLKSLDVFQCLAGDNAAHRRNAIPVPPWHLEYLAFGEFPQNTITGWIAAESAEITVDYFRILSLGPDASSFNAVLKKIGNGLRRLELPSMYRVGVALGPDVPLSIRDCTALTTLSFSERGAFDPGRSITSLLSQVRSANLTTVSFELHFKTVHLDMLWEGVDNVLTTDTFGNLEKVVFNMWGEPFEYGGIPPFEEAVLLMEERLVLLQARGLLRFNAPDDAPQVGVVVPPQPRHVPQTARNWVLRKGGISFMSDTLGVLPNLFRGASQDFFLLVTTVKAPTVAKDLLAREHNFPVSAGTIGLNILP